MWNQEHDCFRRSGPWAMSFLFPPLGPVVFSTWQRNQVFFFSFFFFFEWWKKCVVLHRFQVSFCLGLWLQPEWEDFTLFYSSAHLPAASRVSFYLLVTSVVKSLPLTETGFYTGTVRCFYEGIVCCSFLSYNIYSFFLLYPICIFAISWN